MHVAVRARLLALPLIVSALLPASSPAEYLYFARGGQAELPATTRGATVEVTTPDGPLTFPLAAFRAIVPGGRLDDDWRERRAVAERDGSAASLFAAAWWALEHGLTPEATALIRVAASHPEAAAHAPLLRASRLLDQLEAPTTDPDMERLRPALGGSGWVESRGRHVLLLHQATASDAAARLDVLDRVVTTYYLTLAAQGVELPVPARRLVSVWFARQGDYVAFLRRVDAAPFANTQGYYHPTLAAVFAFDTRSAPDQDHPRQALARRRASPGRTADDIIDIDRQRLLLDLRWRGIDLGIAAHETVHQLVAASGLASRFDAWPNWLHEGFATQFEVVRGGRWAGVGRANDHRLPDWRTIHPAPELAPLLRDDGLTHGYHRGRYAEAWSLVYFLRKAHPDRFATYLTLLQNPRADDLPGPPTAAFTAAFGDDLGALQADWHHFMRTQATPLESHPPRSALAKSP